MANKPYAIEWLTKAHHDLLGAKLLVEAEHYTDTISYVLHQSLEKTLKAILAYENKPIVKTHNLVELYELMSDSINLEDDKVFLLSIATTYQTKQRYPVVHKQLPSKAEIREVLCFSEAFFQQVLQHLEMREHEVTD
jgi:HEPN domain-containing protein